MALDTKRTVILPMLATRPPPSDVQMETKDILVSLPLVGSAIAVSWEIGSFIPIGSGPFGMFSLSEHLLFAIQALPVGLTIAVLIPVILLAVENVGRRRRRRFTQLHSRSAKKLRIAIAVAVTFFFVMAGILAYMAVHARSLTVMILAVCTATIGLVFGLYPPVLALRPKLLFVTACAFALSLSMGFGCDMMRGRLTYVDKVAANDADLFHMTDVDGADRDVDLLRSGERGLLVYEQASRKLFFVKWDSVKGLEWSRRPLIRLSRPPGTP